MRKIKFRGKSLKNKKWVYGDLMSNICGTRIVRYKETDDGKSLRADWEYVDVEPDTVGQFTGLTDCNSKEIYEGDILGASGRIIGYVAGGVRGYCYDVVFINHSAGEKTWPLYSTVKYDYPYEIVVIGNVFDNPELLKTESK